MSNLKKWIVRHVNTRARRSKAFQRYYLIYFFFLNKRIDYIEIIVIVRVRVIN